MQNKKLKIAIISLTSCEGCEIAVLDLGEQLVKILKNVELINFKYMMDEEVAKLDGCDVAFVEGSPLNNRDIKLLKEVRKKSKKVIALGNCAHLGCVQKIKNYRGKEDVARYVYPASTENCVFEKADKSSKLHKNILKVKKQDVCGGVYESYEKIENNEGGGIDKYVKVNAVIPGCPITKEEFLRCLLDLISGKDFLIKENPVCYECLNNGYECLLQKGEICLGPLTYAGCDAICLKSKQACWGCRGFLPEVTVASESSGRDSDGTGERYSGGAICKLINLRAKLREIASDNDVESVEEVFGLKQAGINTD